MIWFSGTRTIIVYDIIYTIHLYTIIVTNVKSFRSIEAFPQLEFSWKSYEAEPVVRVGTSFGAFQKWGIPSKAIVYNGENYGQSYEIWINLDELGKSPKLPWLWEASLFGELLIFHLGQDSATS